MTLLVCPLCTVGALSEQPGPTIVGGVKVGRARIAVAVAVAVDVADHAPVRTQLTQPLRPICSSLQQLHGLGSTVAVGA